MRKNYYMASNVLSSVCSTIINPHNIYLPIISVDIYDLDNTGSRSIVLFANIMGIISKEHGKLENIVTLANEIYIECRAQ